jgi:peptidoglycan/xylan/chitin deacetylase (PgdA/CDA1 family)
MSGFKHTGIDLAFRAMAALRADRWSRGLAQGVGAILMMHHVRPFAPRGFAPNRLLEITPDFLDRTLTLVRTEGYDIVSMDEALFRLEQARTSTKPQRFFVTLTFDDGYRDNVEEAWPVMARHKVPWMMYVTPGFADGTASLWWLEFEEATRRLPHISVDTGSRIFSARAGTDAEKQAAFDRLYWMLRAGPEADLRRAISSLATEAGVDGKALVQSLCLPWDTLKALTGAADITIGAHTMTHPMLAKHDIDVARTEIVESKSRLEAELGQPVTHFAYPLGDPGSAGQREFALAKQAGFTSAVTTRPGHLFAQHADHLHALPRVSLNGYHQNEAALRGLLSGLPFMLWNRGRRLNVA